MVQNLQRPLVVGVVHDPRGATSKERKQFFMREWKGIREGISALPHGAKIGLELTKEDVESIQNFCKRTESPVADLMRKARKTGIRDVFITGAVVSISKKYEIVALDNRTMHRRAGEVKGKIGEINKKVRRVEVELLRRQRQQNFEGLNLQEIERGLGTLNSKLQELYKKLDLYNVLRSKHMAETMLAEMPAVSFVGDGHAREISEVFPKEFRFSFSPEAAKK
ncbi:MAG: hypothetical protein V1676_05425 [Candidatus Diapherotrites archaeon]